MLEDTRSFDVSTLTRLLASTPPEVRRRAMLSVARIRDARGVGLLRAAPLERDTALAATRVFAVGQLHDTLTVPWFDSLLVDPRTPRMVLTDAACALGKIKTAVAREVLARFLTHAVPGPRTDDAIGEALLSIGRATARGDLAPVVKWAASANEEIRWRATWALFRPRDPAAVSTLVKLARDRAAEVRSWAVRGLAEPQADSASLGERAKALLVAATKDADRRVRTEALRALATYNDSAAVALLVDALSSNDSWIAVTGAEGLARARATWTIPRLLDASRSSRSCAVRVTAMRTLNGFAKADARTAAAGMANDSASYCHDAAAALLRDTTPNSSRGGRGGGRGPRPPVTIAARPMDEYRAIVERWVVPAYEGRPLPRARWETSRGTIELELYAGDAPLAMDALEHITNAGTMVGTEFSRVVADFVDQQATIRDAAVQRDEVNRHRLTRGNLAWASGWIPGVPATR